MKHQSIYLLLAGLLATAFHGLHAQSISKNKLTKKWYLQKYEYNQVRYPLAKNEKGDYILLKTNMTYLSSDKGKVTQGKWRFNASAKFILLYDEQGKHLKLFIKKLSVGKMVVEVDLKEMRGLAVHYYTRTR